MALHLEEVPEFHCTINLVPSLLTQLEAYVNGATDTHLTMSRRPVDGLERDDAIYLLDNFFMAFADSMIRPHPRYHELYMMRASWAGPAEPALLAVPASRPPRPSGLVESGLDSPPALREGPRARRVQGQGTALHRGGEALAARQAARAARPGHPPAPHAGRARAGRADHHALLPPDPPLAAGQEARARGHARRAPCRAIARVTRRTPRSTSAARWKATSPGSAPLLGACGPARARSASPWCRCWPATASSGSPPTRRSWAVPPEARSGETAGATSVIPICSTGAGRRARAITSCRMRLPRPLDVGPGRLPLPAQSRAPSPPATSWASCTPSATPAGTTRPRSSR